MPTKKKHLNAIHSCPKTLQEATTMVRTGDVGCNEGRTGTTAARVHGVPKTSLHNRSRIKGKVIRGVKSGPKQYLSAEEETESQICIYLTNIYWSCVILYINI